MYNQGKTPYQPLMVNNNVPVQSRRNDPRYQGNYQYDMPPNGMVPLQDFQSSKQKDSKRYSKHSNLGPQGMVSNNVPVQSRRYDPRYQGNYQYDMDPNDMVPLQDFQSGKQKYPKLSKHSNLGLQGMANNNVPAHSYNYDPRYQGNDQYDMDPNDMVPLQDFQSSKKKYPKHYSKHSNLGLQRLDSYAGIFVKQKFEKIEAAIGYETENKYYVHALDHTGNKSGPKVFKCKEHSGACARQCLSGACRPFEMDISTIIRGEYDDSTEPFLHLSRPCKCTCLCLARPELSVTLVEGDRESYLGKITEPYRCCNMEQHVFDQENNHRYSIVGSCNQLGFWCRCPCDTCQTLEFDIKTPFGENIGHIQKRGQGCIKEAFADADNFAINFPINCPAEDKALLMSAVLFMDYNYFESSPADHRSH